MSDPRDRGEVTVDKMKIYLDTSVINFLYADDAPEYRSATLEFFRDYVTPAIYDVYVSNVVIDEIQRTENAKRRSNLLKAITVYNIGKVEYDSVQPEILELASLYVESGIIPRKQDADALHVAIATATGMDVLLSWNYRHLANINKELLIQGVNRKAGFAKPLRLCTPLEMLHEKA